MPTKTGQICHSTRAVKKGVKIVRAKNCITFLKMDSGVSMMGLSTKFIKVHLLVCHKASNLTSKRAVFIAVDAILSGSLPPFTNSSRVPATSSSYEQNITNHFRFKIVCWDLRTPNLEESIFPVILSSLKVRKVQGLLSPSIFWHGSQRRHGAIRKDRNDTKRAEQA